LKMKKIESRFNYINNYHNQMQEELKEKETFNEEIITPEYLTACIREAIDQDTVILNEGISNYKVIYTHMKSTRPGSIISSGAGSLGWNGGAAFGAKLALKDKTIVNLTGDGSYMFSIPSTVHWLSRRYEAPFLTVIYNNRGWKSPKQSTLGVHPNGVAHELDEYFVDFTPHADLAKIAEAAGGAMAITVKDPKDVKQSIDKALEAVKNGKSAVLDVYLPAVKLNSKSDENAQLLLK
jgi:acetolactate synthase I/II/III large subunit